MSWTKPVYSKSRVDWAGKVLINPNALKEDKKEAFLILNNWRASHDYPNHIFKKRLRSVSKRIDKNSITGGRLKRVRSILRKLGRSYDGKKPTMKFSRMQDIGGCRVVLSNSKLCEQFYDKYYLKGDLKHEKVRVYDYIANPKADGYRGIHVIYKYKSQKKGKEVFNGLLIEIQIRSKLQHIWATSLEVVDNFTGQAIKFGEGLEKWKEFFRLVSCAFAIMEYRPRVPGVSYSKEKLYKKIQELESELCVLDKMIGWAKSIETIRSMKKQGKGHYFLLELDTDRQQLVIRAYTKEQQEKALKQYQISEEKIEKRKEFDVVLVSASNIEDLEKAYPNYFVDVKGFLSKLEYLLKKVKE